MTDRGGFAVEVSGAGKRYGSVVAIDGIDLRVEPRSTVGLVGPNGAGKSTLIRSILGRVALDRGRVDLEPVGTEVSTARVGAVLDGESPEPYLSIGELFRWRRAVVGGGGPDGGARLRELGVGLDERRRVGELSRGQLQFVLWALALVGRPDVVVLDEPLAHLDPLQREACQRLLVAERARGAAVLLSTHVSARRRSRRVGR